MPALHLMLLFAALAPLPLQGAGATGRAGPADLAKWHGRSVYFVVTDRFARDAGNASSSAAGCGNGTKEWCGGTLRGVTRQLDYIAGMGFDALWITPVVEQVPWRDHWNGTGYHGYWARDFHEIDPHLGTKEDLSALSAACKQRGMLLMVDVVANHVGPIHSIEQLTALGPQLNSPSGAQVHTLDRRPGETMAQYISCPDVWPNCAHPVEMTSAGRPPFGSNASGVCYPNYTFGGGCNHTVILDGWFGDLADLNQEHPPTAVYLLDWIQGMVKNYSIDGLRLDTALYMPCAFLRQFQQAAGVYIVGEVVTTNHSLHRSFSPPLSGLLNFPLSLHFRGGEIWGHAADGQRGSMQALATVLEEQSQAQYPDPHLLGNFLDNHDGQRFLYDHAAGGDAILQNGLALVMLYHGVPIVYYGTEQPALAGLADQRTAMFNQYSTSTPVYKFLAQINSIRRAMGFAPGGADVHTEASIVPTLITDHHTLVIVRGGVVVLLSNRGRHTSSAVSGVDAPPHTQAADGTTVEAGASNPPHTRLTCMNTADLGPRWASVCPGTGSTICAGVRNLLEKPTSSLEDGGGGDVENEGEKARCTCRDDKAQMCVSSGGAGGQPAIFGLSHSPPVQHVH